MLHCLTRACAEQGQNIHLGMRESTNGLNDL